MCEGVTDRGLGGVCEKELAAEQGECGVGGVHLQQQLHQHRAAPRTLKHTGSRRGPLEGGGGEWRGSVQAKKLPLYT